MHAIVDLLLDASSPSQQHQFSAFGWDRDKEKRCFLLQSKWIQVSFISFFAPTFFLLLKNNIVSFKQARNFFSCIKKTFLNCEIRFFQGGKGGEGNTLEAEMLREKKENGERKERRDKKSTAFLACFLFLQLLLFFLGPLSKELFLVPFYSVFHPAPVFNELHGHLLLLQNSVGLSSSFFPRLGTLKTWLHTKKGTYLLQRGFFTSFFSENETICFV